MMGTKLNKIALTWSLSDLTINMAARSALEIAYGWIFLGFLFPPSPFSVARRQGKISHTRFLVLKDQEY